MSMHRTPLRAASLALVAIAALGLSGCFLTGGDPADTIPQALLDSDLQVLEADAGKSTDGFSVNVWASVVVERDQLSSDDLREILRIVVNNTHISDVNAISVIALSDELETTDGFEDNVRIDLVPTVHELGLPDQGSGRTGSIEVSWDDVISLLESDR